MQAPGSATYPPTPCKAACLAAAGLLLAALGGCKPPPPPPPPPPDVDVAGVVRKDEAIQAEWIGSLDGFVNAQIRAQVSGYLLRQAYKDGEPVKKGDLLFQIDPRPFLAVYDQMKANYGKAVLDLKRESELVRTQAVAQEDYDNAVQAELAEKAELEQAQLNLDFTRITSPVDGIAGIATAQVGDLVGPSSGILTTVSQVDPIKADFAISEKTYLDFEADRPGQPRFPGGIELELILSDGSVYPLKGRIYATAREIDPGTGTLQVVGEFPNPRFLLRPGQYAQVRAVVRVEKGALLVPQRAVNELQGSYQVATVDDANRAHLKTVKVGDRVGSDWIIEQGLSATDRVVVEGLQKATEGALVNPHFVAGAK